MHYPKPRGRPRKNCEWCSATGKWILLKDTSRPYPVVQPNCKLSVKASLISKQDGGSTHDKRMHDKWMEEKRRKKEEGERTRAFEAECARIRDRKRVEAETRARERMDAPRLYAASLTHCGDAPVYYLDTNNNMQELGKESSHRTPGALTRYSVPITYMARKDGPSVKDNLEEGEWELVEVTTSVLRYS